MQKHRLLVGYRDSQ